jgi:hypothetical protein
MSCEPSSNSFRAEVFGGRRSSPLISEKKRRQVEGEDSLEAVSVPRSEIRRGNHRDDDRHRLSGETATATHKRKRYTVDLINVSGGGAMIRADFKPLLWDMVELSFGDGPGVQGAVRWMRDNRIGLEFAHETHIECDAEQRDALLLDVIRRSFPDVEVSLKTPEPREKAEATSEDAGNRLADRHPLIWSGEILYAHDSYPGRLRNISPGGALVEVGMTYPVGADVMLDLGDAGQFMATIAWTFGDQAGLKFHQPFDLTCLAKARPDVTPHRWDRPTFLDVPSDAASPWDEEWSRKSLADLRSDLEGFMKR